DESYRHNCLVNAMCVGIIEHSALTRAVAAGPGNPVLLVGADTGRDGIHGATFASVELDEQSEERRPAVQVWWPWGTAAPAGAPRAPRSGPGAAGVEST